MRNYEIIHVKISGNMLLLSKIMIETLIDNACPQNLSAIACSLGKYVLMRANTLNESKYNSVDLSTLLKNKQKTPWGFISYVNILVRGQETESGSVEYQAGELFLHEMSPGSDRMTLHAFLTMFSLHQILEQLLATASAKNS